MNNFLYLVAEAMQAVEVTDHAGEFVETKEAISRIVRWSKFFHAEGGKLMFIGNGGSAAIASHMATDWMKNGGFRAMSFNDGASLTCLGNDLGYENVFALPIERHAQHNDTLFAISSSGKSQNILHGVNAASSRASKIVTLSGFSRSNPLRKMGTINFYVPSDDYGVVECSHLALVHAMLNEAMGLTDKASTKAAVAA